MVVCLFLLVSLRRRKGPATYLLFVLKFQNQILKFWLFCVSDTDGICNIVCHVRM